MNAVWCFLSSFSETFVIFISVFLAQTPPLRPCCRAVYLSPPSPVSHLLFTSLCILPSLSVPPLWSRGGVLLGERCATQMMSHPVTLSSPPPSSLSLQLALTNRSVFSSTRRSQIARTCCRMVRGAHKRCHFILTRTFPVWQRRQTTTFPKAAGTTSTDMHLQTCRCLVVWRILF